MTFSQGFRNKMLRIEMENLLNREKEMFDLYTELILDINDEAIKKTLATIKFQEDGHIRMVKDIISLMGEYIRDT